MSEANFGHEIEDAPSRPEGSELQDTVTTEPKDDQERSSSPEAKIAQAEKVIADMREWLTQNGLDSTEQIDNTLSELTVEYDNDTDQAITSGSLSLYSLTSAEGLTLPQSVGGSLYLNYITSAEGLTLPESVGGQLQLESLTSAEGLTLPESVGGTLNLNLITSAEGLTLPESIGGSLYLGSLTSAEGLTLPESIGGSLYLHSLTSAEGLTLPQSVGGSLSLYSLTSAEGLTLPQSVGGTLGLRYLTSAEGLTLPQSVVGDIDLSSLTHEDRQKLREQRPDLADKIKDEKIPSYGRKIEDLPEHTPQSPDSTIVDSPPPPPRGPELTVEEAPAKFNELYQRLLRAMPIEGLSLPDGGITYNYEKNGGDVQLTLVSNEVSVSITKTERAASGGDSASLFISTNAQGANTAEFNFVSNGQLRQVNLDPDQTSEVINTVYAQMLELAVKGEESHGKREAEAKQQVDSALKDFLS